MGMGVIMVNDKVLKGKMKNRMKIWGKREFWEGREMGCEVEN